MSREILFRGKRTNNGEWVEGSLHKEYGETRKDGSRSIDYRILGMRGECDYIIPETAGQHTGLTDKNGECIFKDDIVRFDDGQTKFKGKVTNECGAWGIATQDMIPLELKYSCKNDNFISFWELMWNSDDPDCLIDGYVPYVEVIGNIHDNPELLEVSE